MGADFVIEQDWGSYGEDEHETWRILFARQQDILLGIVEGLDEFIALGLQDVAKEFIASLLTIRNKRGL